MTKRVWTQGKGWVTVSDKKDEKKADDKPSTSSPTTKKSD